jgi:opacity protein-like surface antigen
MNRIKLFLSALAFLTLVTGMTRAADIDTVIPAMQEDPYVPVEVGSGWYIRGDIGYNLATKYNNDEYTFAPVTHKNNFRDAVSASVGVGYRINDLFRLDGTVDHLFKSDFSSTKLVAPTGPCLGTGEYIDLATSTTYFAPYSISNCLQQDKSSYDAFMMMGNAYVDLGTFVGVTPYLGAGLGVARISWAQETASITCVPQNGSVHLEACKASGTATQPGISNGKDWRVAMSITGGFSYQINQNLSLDTSYKFTSVGLGTKGIPNTTTAGSDMSKAGFGLHQIKMGLRYDIW